MTLKESYQSAYARKSQAIRAQYTTKKAVLTAKKKRLREQGAEQLRQAYGDHMRAVAAAEQQNRAAGRFAGAAENQKAGMKAEHREAQESRMADAAADIGKVEEQLVRLTANKDKKLEDNAIALQQKLEALERKESTAKAGGKSVGGGGSKGLSRSQVISLIKMGIYDSSFAGILGISDDQVMDYVKNLTKKKKEPEQEKKTSSAVRLDGTYKPPLK